MSTEKKEEKEQTRIKLSELTANKTSAVPEAIQEQIKNNQELYTTLSRSILELHNDMREFRKKSEAMDKGLFSMQQGINKVFSQFNTQLQELDKRITDLTEAWNTVVKSEDTKEAKQE